MKLKIIKYQAKVLVALNSPNDLTMGPDIGS